MVAERFFDRLARLKLELEIQILRGQLEGSAPFLLPEGRRGAPPQLPAEVGARILLRIREAEELLTSLPRLPGPDEDRFSRLCQTLELSATEQRILLLAVGPAIDPAFRQLYATFEESGLGRPTVAGAVSLLLPAGERLGAQRCFWESGKLRRYRLIELLAAFPGQQDLLRKQLEASSRLVAHLLGSPGPEGAERRFLTAAWPRLPLTDVVLAGSIDATALVATLQRTTGPLLVLHGPVGVGKKTLAGALARSFGIEMVVANLAAMPGEPDRFDEALRAAFREAALQDSSLLLFDGVQALLLPEGERSRLGALVAVLEEYPERATVLASTAPVDLRLSRERPGFYLSLPQPKVRERTALWRRYLPAMEGASQISAEELAHKFSFTGGAIRHAAQVAASLARLRAAGPGGHRLQLTDFLDACKASSQSSLSSLAIRLDRYFRWEDLVLRDKTRASIEELILYARNRQRVFEEWGFDRKLPYGRGVTALFHGEPGTGKTMVACLLSQDLNMDLYQIDLSRVVSKYIGETEKNMAAIFDEARDAHAILLFDEADSLFARRTDVRSSNDRYANLEVNYLLQRIEAYEGISILTSNHEAAIDDAFKRRLTFVVEFPAPDAEERVSLWESMFPDLELLAPDVDLEYLAEEFELTGGHIKKVVLRAAFRAAEELAPGARPQITMSHLLDGAAAVYREMGKLFKHE